jgi:hypothetical protein
MIQTRGLERSRRHSLSCVTGVELVMKVKTAKTLTAISDRAYSGEFL